MYGGLVQPECRPACGAASSWRRCQRPTHGSPQRARAPLDGLIHLPWASSAKTAFIAALGGGDEDGLLAARGQRLFGGPPEVLRGGEFGVPFGIVCSLESETNALSGNVFRAASARLCHSCQLSATSIASGAPRARPFDARAGANTAPRSCPGTRSASRRR